MQRIVSASAKSHCCYAALTLDRYQRSVAVSPEGTRSTTGEIQEFKKVRSTRLCSPPHDALRWPHPLQGPFYLAEEVGKLGVPIVPVILHGAFDLWPPKQVFASAGDVTLRVAEPIVMTPTMTRDELSAQVHRSMVSNLAEMSAAAKGHKHTDGYSAALSFLVATGAAAAALKWRYW